MASSNSSVVHSSQDIQLSEIKSPKDPKVDTNESNRTTLDVLQCFVCDSKVQGRHYALATCRTQSTRTRVIEKLGELVGERYMVVISEDDVICRSCANLINTLDRIESEIKGVRGTILRYLERKYSLEEGELLNNNESVKHSQPPHITTSGENEKKRKGVNLLDDSVSKNKQKKSIWLQCDKCRYTTNYNTFMVHHIRQHVNQRINCDRCGVQFIGNNQQNNSHKCKEKQKQTECRNQSSSIERNTAETEDVESLENGDLAENLVPFITAEDQSVSIKEDEQEDVKAMNMPDLENFQPDDVETQDGDQEFDLEQENVSDEAKPILPEETDVNGDLVFQKKEISAKQILTVAEDGSLEMMGVEAWQEKNAISKGEES